MVTRFSNLVYVAARLSWMSSVSLDIVISSVHYVVVSVSPRIERLGCDPSPFRIFWRVEGLSRPLGNGVSKSRMELSKGNFLTTYVGNFNFILVPVILNS